jgi:hypothetical protein
MIQSIIMDVGALNIDRLLRIYTGLEMIYSRKSSIFEEKEQAMISMAASTAEMQLPAFSKLPATPVEGILAVHCSSTDPTIPGNLESWS